VQYDTDVSDSWAEEDAKRHGARFFAKGQRSAVRADPTRLRRVGGGTSSSSSAGGTCSHESASESSSEGNAWVARRLETRRRPRSAGVSTQGVSNAQGQRAVTGEEGGSGKGMLWRDHSGDATSSQSKGRTGRRSGQGRHVSRRGAGGRRSKAAVAELGGSPSGDSGKGGKGDRYGKGRHLLWESSPNGATAGADRQDEGCGDGLAHLTLTGEALSTGQAMDADEPLGGDQQAATAQAPHTKAGAEVDSGAGDEGGGGLTRSEAAASGGKRPRRAREVDALGWFAYSK